MFLEKVLSDTKYRMLYDIYEDEYLEPLDYRNFVSVYQVFQKYKFYFIEDIILNYLDIFTIDPKYVEDEIILLRDVLGDNFVYIIGHDMRYLEKMLG